MRLVAGGSGGTGSGKFGPFFELTSSLCWFWAWKARVPNMQVTTVSCTVSLAQSAHVKIIARLINVLLPPCDDPVQKTPHWRCEDKTKKLLHDPQASLIATMYEELPD